jgi:hypothetical protein
MSTSFSKAIIRGRSCVHQPLEAVIDRAAAGVGV